MITGTREIVSILLKRTFHARIFNTANRVLQKTGVKATQCLRMNGK